MEESLINCVVHKRLNEIHCTECNTFLCLECIAGHKTETHKAKYVHVMHHAKSQTLHKIDSLKTSVENSESKLEIEAKELVEGINKLAPEINETVNLYMERFEKLKGTMKVLMSCIKYSLKGDYKENVRKSLEIEKKQLQRLIKAQDVKELLKLTQKIEEETKVAKNQERSQDLLLALRSEVREIKDSNVYKSILVSAKSLVAKSNIYRLSNYQKDWTCDRKYLSIKMYLSPDNLTFGNTATNGYPGIIGTMAFDIGLYAYEAIPVGLDCNEKEGFGIIEKDAYLEAHKSDPVTPIVYNKMIGFLYRKEARNMTVEKIKEMSMNEKYYVRVNIPDLLMTINGPGVKLSTHLKPGVVYYPCFSCGCSNNRIKIRPLSHFEENMTK